MFFFPAPLLIFRKEIPVAGFLPRLAFLLAALLMTLAPAAPVAGQGNEQDTSRPPTFLGSTDLVVLHVSVTDRKGRYVPNLPKSAFRVLEDGRPQQIAFFTNDDVPVTVGLIVDGSISMYTVRDRVIAAVGEFAKTSRAGDETFALAFNETVRAALPESAPFTENGNVLKQGLESVMATRGRTAVLDAIADGLTYVARGTAPRKALILISDGGDNASHTTIADVRKAVASSDAVIYAVALIDPDDHDANTGLLHTLADQSGGEVFTPHDASDVTALLERIGSDIRRSYTVGYAPERPADGTYRHVQVRVSSQEKGRLTVRTRNGYLAAALVPTIDASPSLPESPAPQGQGIERGME
jgi:Ca-activated chloride channel family protein